MNEEVYDFLRDYGFTKEEVYSFQEENEKMFFTNLMEVNKNIAFLIEKGLKKEEVLNLLKLNPYMITVKDNRLIALDKIYYEELNFNKEELKKTMMSNSDIYTISPIELQKNIDFLKNKSCTTDVIKNLFIKNPKLISMKFEDFEKIIKFS